MSHRIIITSQQSIAQSTASAAPTSAPDIEYEITYTPDHALTPAQQGAKTAQILRLLEKMQEPVGE